MCTHVAHKRHIDQFCCYFMIFVAKCALCAHRECAWCAHILLWYYHLKIRHQSFPTPCRKLFYDKNSLLWFNLKFWVLNSAINSINSKDAEWDFQKSKFTLFTGKYRSGRCYEGLRLIGLGHFTYSWGARGQNHHISSQFSSFWIFSSRIDFLRISS